jgi:hypothetical protein
LSCLRLFEYSPILIWNIASIKMGSRVFPFRLFTSQVSTFQYRCVGCLGLMHALG